MPKYQIGIVNLFIYSKKLIFKFLKEKIFMIFFKTVTYTIKSYILTPTIWFYEII